MRGSRKLQALEEIKGGKPALAASAGVVNAAYTGLDEQDDDDDEASDAAFANAGLAWAALAQNNYLLNGGIQKIIGTHCDHRPNRNSWLTDFI